MPGIRDKALLDALEEFEQTPFSGSVWRAVREGRRPDVCSRSGGRWDDGEFDVLYTSLEAEGATEEKWFHAARGQPFPPSKIGYELYQVSVDLNAVVTIPSLDELSRVGFPIEYYGRLSYVERKREYLRSQEIAEACFFLGADGLIVPNARHESMNLIVFCDQDPMPTIGEIEYQGRIDWANKIN